MTLESGAGRASLALADVDDALTVQLAVAWAGETGEQRRLGWWRSDLVSPYGGLDLFHRLLPNTFEWAVLQAAREAARRKDAECRARDHNPDRLLSLFHLGFELDERIDERLWDLKTSGRSPVEALRHLKDVVDPAWSRDRFLEWVRKNGEVETTETPTGRRLLGHPPDSPGALVSRLLGALAPFVSEYPLPHYLRKPA